MTKVKAPCTEHFRPAIKASTVDMQISLPKVLVPSHDVSF